tara:strand:+ start:411 stop:608 length:198 start_codon:yes stop_codon:yes gene_type:complete
MNPKIKIEITKSFSFLYKPGETKFQICKKMKGNETINAQYAVILKGTKKVAESFVEIIEPLTAIN